MTNEQFLIEVERSFLRSKILLIKKGKEYTSAGDRLDQFHRAAAAQRILPTEALMGMATKHFTSIADMSKDPGNFTTKQWHDKLDDLRNYTFLLDALVTDVRE
uniref:Uncharacterized protein n=1 Tax=viral metagenome TaxID=1070528 RepID=A0A6H1ZZ67_9ZZZZ